MSNPFLGGILWTWRVLTDTRTEALRAAALQTRAGRERCRDLSAGGVRVSLDCRMQLDQPNEHILHHQRGCGGLANILDVIHRAKRSCLLICYLYLAQLNLWKKKIKDANTGSAVGTELNSLKRLEKHH